MEFDIYKGDINYVKQKIESKILSWIQDDNKALLIDGARQVGKTYVIRKVLSEHNLEYVELFYR